MKAIDLKKQFVKDEKLEDVGVIAIKKKDSWWHVHDNEEIPNEENLTIALHPRNVSY